MPGQWVDCLFAHSDMQTLPETNQRLRDVLCDYYSTFNKPDVGYPLPEHDPERVSLFHSSIGTNWGNAICNNAQYEEAHEALDFALAIDDEQHRVIDLESIWLPARQANLKESCRLLSPSGQCEQEQDRKPIWHWHKSPSARCGIMLRPCSYIEKLINRKSGA